MINQNVVFSFSIKSGIYRSKCILDIHRRIKASFPAIVTFHLRVKDTPCCSCYSLLNCSNQLDWSLKDHSCLNY